VGAALIYAVGRTDRRTEGHDDAKSAFRDYVKAHSNRNSYWDVARSNPTDTFDDVLVQWGANFWGTMAESKENMFVGQLHFYLRPVTDNTLMSTEPILEQ
jgi:hypothetical protein